MISHLGHQLVVIEEQQADHSDDEESCSSGLQEATEKAAQVTRTGTGTWIQAELHNHSSPARTQSYFWPLEGASNYVPPGSI